MKRDHAAEMEQVSSEVEQTASAEQVSSEVELARVDSALAIADREKLDATLQKKMGLSLAQVIALQWLIEGRSAAHAARAAKVNVGTVYRWMQHDAAFVEQLESLKRDQLQAAGRRLAAITDRAIDAIEAAIGRGDGRLALDLLREMKVTARSASQESAGGSDKAVEGESNATQPHDLATQEEGDYRLKMTGLS